MSIKRLKQYMDKIECGKAINFPSFYKFIKTLSLGVTISPDLFETEKTVGDNYIVTILSESLTLSLKRLANTNMTSRGTLAKQNSSHETGVSGSLVIFKQAFGHSQVLEFDRDGDFTPKFNQTNTCLVIENLDNFLYAKATFDFLLKGSALDQNKPIDIYFASGNAITNKLHNKLFQHYSIIYLALDLDLGGLKIAKTFISAFGSSKVEYLLPVDIEERLRQVERRKDSCYLKEVDAIGRSTPSLAAACKLITRYGKILEQESYIDG